MATRSLNVQITGDAKSLGVAAKQADRHMDGLGKSAGRMGKVMAAGFATAGAAAAGALVVGLKKSVDAAAEAEKSQARMVAQLKAAGIPYQEHAKEIDAVIQKHSQLAALDDEDLQDAFTNIVRVTKDVDKSMKLVGLAADVARAKHMDVAKAGELVGKVAGGNTGVLARYGIQIEKGASASEALAQMQKLFAGQAEAYGKTAAGAQERFGVAVENLQEKMGQRFLPVVTKVTNGVANFVSGMESGKGAGGRFADTVGAGMNRVRQVVDRVKAAVSAWVARNRDDIDSVINAFKAVAKFAKDVFEDTALPIIRRTFNTIGKVIDGLVHTVRGVIRLITGLLSGDWDKAWSGAKEAVAGAFKVIKSLLINAIENLWEIVKDLGPDLIKLIGKGLKGLGKSLATGIYEGVKWAVQNVPGMIGGLLGGLGKKLIGALIPGGDGIGKALLGGVGDGVGAALPRFGGGLMGANPALAPIAGIASRFGLGVSSGLRPGAITSSGNPSFHGTGEALDVAGTPAGMLGFFRYMKSTMGRGLAELIYTPGGSGVKNGSAFTYSGQVARDHYDHVHVAVDLPGVGDGIGQAVDAARRAGFTGTDLVRAVAIAGAESRYDADAKNFRYPDHSIGFWQINQLAHRGRFGTDAQLEDPYTNARAAYALFKESGFRPWSTWPAAAQAYIARARAAVTGSRGSSGGATSGGSGGSSKPKRGTSVATGGGYDPQAMYNSDAPRMRTVTINGRRVRVPDTDYNPVFAGRGNSIKGLSQEDADRLAAGRADAAAAAPTEFDYLDLALANAEATADTGDDRSALTAIRDYRARALAAASATGDPRQIAQARRDLTSAEKALTELTDNTAALAEALEGVRSELKRNADIAERVRGTNEYQLTKMLADVIGGHFGRGIVSRSFTPGSGVEYAY